MRETFRPVNINFAHVDVVGVPGLALVFIAIALEFPETRWVLLGSLAGGIAVAAVLIRRRRTKNDRTQ
jgi:hypothetical protein